MDLNKAKKGFVSLDKEDLNDPGTMLVVEKLLEKQQENYILAAESLANKLNISTEFAAAILYLRGRHRWSQSLEDNLVAMARNNESVPNMNEYGCTPESGAALMKTVRETIFRERGIDIGD